MRTLLEKEIRLLLPAFGGALALAILPVWLMPYNHQNPSGVPPELYILGTMILALSSYGREIGCKTFSFMLAQPLERARIWWTKIAVLAVFVVLVFEAWWLSTSLCSIRQPALLPSLTAMTSGVLYVAALVTGGLWMTLLLRQTVAAFWLGILLPLAMCLAIEELGGKEWMIFPALGIYAVAAFFLARRQFLHLQDTAWTGGVLSIGRARAATERTASREHRPLAALIGKEFQLQQVTLLAMACLLALHLGAIFLHKAGAHVFSRPMLVALEGVGLLWFIVPWLAGSQSVADERQLGTLDGLLCLPVSRRLQFTIKLIFVLVVGGLLSGALLCAVERVGSAMAPGFNWNVRDNGGICLAFLALSLIGFYGSTLTRGVVPALAAGAVVSIVLWWIFITSVFYSPWYFLWPVCPVVAFLVLTGTFIWLAYGNFRSVFESGRRWRRNILALTTVIVLVCASASATKREIESRAKGQPVIVLVCASASATYHRFWEWGAPLEKPHGPARLPVGKPLLLSDGANGTLAVVLPDGRLWENHFVAGSNWVAAFANWRETVAIRSDGTLWVSEKPRKLGVRGSHAPLVQFGVESDWQSLACDTYSSVVLLKRDGTMWNWGSSHVNDSTYQGLRVLKPVRLGAESDWARVLRGGLCFYAWKRDGRVWVVRTGYRGLGAQIAPGVMAGRAPGLDHVQFRNLNSYSSYRAIDLGVREDGTLWYWDWPKYWWARSNGALPPTNDVAWEVPVQIGKDSNWAAVASAGYQIVALKTDGSIWKWNLERRYVMDFSAFSGAPVRMGTNNDWVGLSGSQREGEVVTLSADGTLWRWPTAGLTELRMRGYDQPLAPSRRPVKIENIFGAPE